MVWYFLHNPFPKFAFILDATIDDSAFIGWGKSKSSFGKIRARQHCFNFRYLFSRSADNAGKRNQQARKNDVWNVVFRVGTQ
jgi:hypothetical protein